MKRIDVRLQLAELLNVRKCFFTFFQDVPDSLRSLIVIITTKEALSVLVVLVPEGKQFDTAHLVERDFETNLLDIFW